MGRWLWGRNQLFFIGLSLLRNVSVSIDMLIHYNKVRKPKTEYQQRERQDDDRCVTALNE